MKDLITLNNELKGVELEFDCPVCTGQGCMICKGTGRMTLRNLNVKVPVDLPEGTLDTPEEEELKSPTQPTPECELPEPMYQDNVSIKEIVVSGSSLSIEECSITRLTRVPTNKGLPTTARYWGYDYNDNMTLIVNLDIRSGLGSFVIDCGDRGNWPGFVILNVNICLPDGSYKKEELTLIAAE